MTLSEFSAGLLHSRAEARTSADRAAVVPVDDDVRAISAALTLCAFLWFLKAFLIGWFLLEKKINPLSDAPIETFGFEGLEPGAEYGQLVRCEPSDRVFYFG